MLQHNPPPEGAHGPDSYSGIEFEGRPSGRIPYDEFMTFDTPVDVAKACRGTKLGSTTPTLTLWHGGNLDEAYDESMAHRKGRWEYGPGLYCTTHYDTAKKYAKGSRKLYRIVLAQGNNAMDVLIPNEDAREFINTHALKAKRAEVLEALARWEGRLKAEWFVNICVNYEALQASKSGLLREFLVAHNVDYLIVDNAFGWHERMVVVFNMQKIVSRSVVSAKEKLTEFNLATEFR